VAEAPAEPADGRAARGDLFERYGMAPSHEVDTGTGLLVTYGGFAGNYLGTSFFVVLTGNDFASGFWPGTLLGTAGAVGTGYYLKSRDFTRDEAMLAWSAGTWGAFTGVELARIIIPSDGRLVSQRTAAAGALSNIGATGLAMLFRNRAPGVDTSGMLLGAGAFGWQAGAGLAQVLGLDPTTDRRLVASLELGGAYAWGLGAWTLQRLGLTAPGPGLTSFYGAQGAWLGAWSPHLFQTGPLDDRLNIGGARIGAGVGAAAALLLTPLSIDHPDRIVGQSLGFSLGTLVGFGVPTFLQEHPTRRSEAAGVLLGSLGGEVLGGWLAPRFESTSGSRAAVAGLSAWAAYQGIGWTLWTKHHRKELDNQREYGITSFAFGASEALALLAPTLWDMEPVDTWTALSAGAWGSAYANWLSFSFEATDDVNLRNMLVAGEVAMVGGLALTRFKEPSQQQLMMVDGLGLGGALLGGLVGIAIDGEPRTATLGTAVGATVGLAGGTALAVLAGPGPETEARAVPWSLGRRGWLASHSPVVPSVMASPWFDEDGGTGALVQLTFTERE